jgi:hypothetical protein
LLDCDDATRVARLRARGPEWRDRTAADFEEHLAWAAWLRGHAADPTWQSEVMRHPATTAEMQWSRLDDWFGDARWRVHAIDTSALPVAEVAAELAVWIARERVLVGSGARQLS